MTFKTAEEVAQYLEQYANTKQKEAAAFVRQQALHIARLENESATDAAIEFDRRRDAEAHAENMFIQCGGYE